MNMKSAATCRLFVGKTHSCSGCLNNALNGSVRVTHPGVHYATGEQPDISAAGNQAPLQERDLRERQLRRQKVELLQNG
jgi:hypothetical protein